MNQSRQWQSGLKVFALIGALAIGSQPAFCQQWKPPTPPISIPQPPPVNIPVVPHTPPPNNTPPPPTIPHVPVIQISPRPDTFINPIDVTSSGINLHGEESPDAMGGLMELSDQDLPPEDTNGSGDYVRVFGGDNSQFSKITPYTVKFDYGNLIVSVRRPSRMGIVVTPLARVVLTPDADVMLLYRDGLLRIINMDGCNQTTKIKVCQDVSSKAKAVALAPGYEFICSARVLSREDVKAQDGVARRRFHMLEQGHVAVSEICLETALRLSSAVARMNKIDNGSQERRIISDMSKMAAVLNYVNGVQGYQVEGTLQVARK